MESLRLSIKYGHGDLGWADKQDHDTLVNLLAYEREEYDAIDRARKRAQAPPRPRGR